MPRVTGLVTAPRGVSPPPPTRGVCRRVVVKTMGVEFFCYHRDRPGSMTLREELLEEHWSYMDRYQAQMIARGPTLQ